MTTISLTPGLLAWARERAGLGVAALAAKFPKYPLWEDGLAHPTLRQLEAFAKHVHVPIGYLFLPTPPVETLPIPDYRTLGDRTPARPSPNLLDTLYLCQQRQDWYREHARMQGFPALRFVGTLNTRIAPAVAAQTIREQLGLSTSERSRLATWTDALRQLIAKAEDAGMLVMTSSIVGSNAHRKLNVEEFRGFVLADPYAPVVFLNAADSKAAQMFTLAHEIAHLWIGESGLVDPEAGTVPRQETERWCNAVAAELLMPLEELRQVYRNDIPAPEALSQLARRFKVSTLVALRRLHDAGYIDRETLWRLYNEERERVLSLERSAAPGGDFYRTLGARTGKRFARAVLASTLEGQTLFQEAFRMLGVRKTATFYEAAHELGVVT